MAPMKMVCWAPMRLATAPGEQAAERLRTEDDHRVEGHHATAQFFVDHVPISETVWPLKKSR